MDSNKHLLKALLANYPKQRVVWTEPWSGGLFYGHWEDEDYRDECRVKSIYINENNELSFDLIKESRNNYGDYLGAEELKNVIWDFILNKTYDIDYRVDELAQVIWSLCEDLREVVIPSSATDIGEELFMECESLQKIVISEGVKSIGENAFRGCSSLEIVHLPVGVSNIEFNSFADCNNLKAIYVPKDTVDFYKERFPSDMHCLIIEEGSDL